MPRILAKILFGGLAMATLAHAEISSAHCTQTGPDRYRIDFQLEGRSHRVEVIASLQPNGVGGKTLGEATKSPSEVDVAETGRRYYFFLKPDKGATVEVALRRLPLAGAPNLRDLGGYRTQDGRQVLWGMLYRSSELGHLTAADLEIVHGLGLKAVVDFRNAGERQRSPDKGITGETGTVPAYEFAIGDDDRNAATQKLQEALRGGATPAQLRDLMSSVYEGIALHGAPAFKGALREILTLHGPVVFHCTAGKDRTGLFAAMLLKVLGVSDEEIRQDYLLSNEYLTNPAALSRMAGNMRGAASGAPEASQESIAILAGVDLRYLDAAFAAIDRQYGTFDAYRREALGLTDEDVKALRRALLSD
jgi:protein-tyrosine phosphatase